jgi:hypothetical protein
MATLTVGAGKTFSTLAAAIGASSGGDTILIDAGTYTNDFAYIGHDLTIQGVGGLAKLQAVAQPPNGKAILTTNANVTIDHLEFTGTTVRDGNGAGIRYEGGALVITRSWFHHNQNGILAASASGGTISIDHSEFNNNGAGDGYTHNIYVNDIARLTITNSYFHAPVGGHEIKSRARETVVTNNRIQDGPATAGNYAVDLPNGGAAIISGNVIEKGAQAQNRTFVHLGGELFPSYANTSLSITGNVFVNNATGGPPTLLRNDSSVGGTNAPATISGNIFWNITSGQVALGSATVDGNSFNTGAGPALDLSSPIEAACFRAGTRLATPDGPVAVEDLDPGDEVLSAFGATLKVRWIGHRSLDCRRHPRPRDVLPVRIEAGAFRPGAPIRDLWLSPDHALFLDGGLIPVRYLLNGATILQEEADEVTYFHVEVENSLGEATHTVLMAEGLPAESYLDTGNRRAFANGGGEMQLHPDFAHDIWKRAGIAPLVTEGVALRAVRHRLAIRAIALGHRLVNNPCLTLEVDGRVVSQLPGEGPAVFLLPPGARHALLHSRVFVPAHVIAGSDDHRMLGAGVTRLVLDGRVVDLATLGEGWHTPEAGHRWSDGAGRIALEDVRRVEIEAGVPGLYWEREAPALAPPARLQGPWRPVAV